MQKDLAVRQSVAVAALDLYNQAYRWRPLVQVRVQPWKNMHALPRECVLFVFVCLFRPHLSLYIPLCRCAVNGSSYPLCETSQRACTHTQILVSTQSDGRPNLSTFGCTDTDNFPCRLVHSALGLGLHSLALQTDK